MRETSFISSGTGTPEYKLIQRLTPELRTAIQDDLQDISDHLLSRGIITRENYQDFTSWARPVYARAASLIQVVQNRIKLNNGYFYDFIQVLEKNKQYYDAILQKIYSHDISVHQRLLYSESQHHSDEESQGECESSALLQSPYVQHEDKTSPEHGGVKSGPRYPSIKDEASEYSGDNSHYYNVIAIIHVHALMFIVIGVVVYYTCIFILVRSFYDKHSFNLLLLFAILVVALVCLVISTFCMLYGKKFYRFKHQYFFVGVLPLIGVTSIIAVVGYSLYSLYQLT